MAADEHRSSVGLEDRAADKTIPPNSMYRSSLCAPVFPRFAHADSGPLVRIGQRVNLSDMRLKAKSFLRKRQGMGGPREPASQFGKLGMRVITDDNADMAGDTVRQWVRAK